MTIRLPLEVLTAIFDEVDDARDLLHIRMASRTLCAAATPFAFRVLSVITTRGSAKNLGQLLDVPDIATHVRGVSYHDTGADRRGRTLKYVRTNAIQELASSFSRIHQLPRLETIDLTFYPIYDHRLGSDGRGRPALQASILGALAASFGVRAPPKLTSLTLHNLRTWELLPLESAPFQTLSVLFDRAPDAWTFSERWCYFWGTLLPRMILAPTQHALTELTLHSDTYISSSTGLSLAGLHFPHLGTLSLRKLIFQPSVGIEPFILRHTATLAQLEILTCGLPHSPLIPAALAQDEEPSSGSGCWDRIWDRFAAELTALVTLHVDLECRYVELGFFWEVDAPESRYAADNAALRRFRMAVAARSEETRGGNSEKESGGA
ncbi:hypothetical protein BJY52DRAFT_1225463 [Lactarius psammicola]|nr:hypothetical protein BJY52DRAFT_1225463 [Lactarius psammicola]